MAEYTPMMQQYLRIKEQNRDAILFFRLGDFYEMFFDDAKTVSRELELVLTGKDCGAEERAPMCGVPYHAADNYIARLVAKGYKVAVCEQTEDPALAKGLVSRDVIRTVTPGTVTESVMLDETKNNYIACVYFAEEGAGFTFCDVSTGELWVAQRGADKTDEGAADLLTRFLPSELLANETAVADKQVRAYVSRSRGVMVSVKGEQAFGQESCRAAVERHFGAAVEALGVKELPLAVSALGCLLGYLYDTQRNSLSNVSEIRVYHEEQYLSLNAAARTNLELTETLRRREKRGSLLWVLDKTKSAMGKRRLRAWVEQPLVRVPAINSRLNAVEELVNGVAMRAELRELLTGVNDLERIATRVVYGSANAKELRALAQTLFLLPDIKEGLSRAQSAKLRELYEAIDTLDDVCSEIASTLVDDPPFSVREGGMIRAGCNAELDSLNEIVSGGHDFLARIEAQEQEKTGIKKLRIGYNRVFGYYIEVLNSFKALVPEHYIRKQTLTNCERYVTPELKDLEARVLGAQDRIVKLEYELFSALRSHVAEAQFRIRRSAAALSELDALLSLAQTADENGYTRPDVDLSGEIEIRDGRHPVVEKCLDGAPFVPNDTFLDGGENRTMIITGPNMAGKSTYMRQTAVIVLMAQMGSFVPAASARIGVVDSIFTRVGASDDLTAGQSTFMTEMSEVAAILENATSRSLIILDEIGRGTSTFDGMSIARAVLEHVTDKRKLGAKTLFATHYHELTALEGEIEGVKNYNTSVKKRGDDVTFLRRIVRGPADGSYGIEVAKLSGVPQSVVARAKVILREMEQGQLPAAPKSMRPKQTVQEELGQMGLFTGANDAVVEELRALDLNTLTPIEALTKLYDLKNRIV